MSNGLDKEKSPVSGYSGSAQNAPYPLKEAKKGFGNFKWLLLAAFVLGLIGGGASLLLKNKASEKDRLADKIKQDACAVLGFDKEDPSPLIKAIDSGMQVRIKKLEKIADGYTAVCEIGNHDFLKAVEQADQTEQGEQTLEEYVTDFAETYKAQPYRTMETTIELKKDGNDYTTQITEEQADAFTGGVLSYSNSKK